MQNQSQNICKGFLWNITPPMEGLSSNLVADFLNIVDAILFLFYTGHGSALGRGIWAEGGVIGLFYTA